MTHPSWALQKAIYERLTGDAQLMAQLAGNGIFDIPPRSAAFPYVVLGPISTREPVIPVEDGTEHRLQLTVWSRVEGKKEALEIAEAIETLLHDADLILDGHHLVNLRLVTRETLMARDRRSIESRLVFRAVTEPSP